MTDVNPEASKDESDVHPSRKPTPMVVTDVNPEVSKDESEVQPRRKKGSMHVIFGAWIQRVCSHARNRP